MNIRTNLRNWREDAIYCVTVNEKGGTIRAELEAITVGPMSRITLDGMLERLQKVQPEIKAYMIQHDPATGITTPQNAIEEAARRFEFDKEQAQGI